MDKTTRILKLFLRLLITAALLWVIFSKIALAQLSQAIKNANWQYLIVVWALAILAFWIRAVKMRFILRRQNCFVKTSTVFGASAITSLYSLILPGLVSTGVKWYILKTHTGKPGRVLSSMAYNQLTDIVTRTSLGLIALAVVNPTGGWKLPTGCAVTTAAILTLVALLLARRTGPVITNYVERQLGFLPESIYKKIRTILEQIRLFQTAGCCFHFTAVAIGLAATLVGIAIYILAAEAASISVPALALAWQSSAVYILGRLPISVANLGVREFTLIELLRRYGAEPPAALLMSMIIFSNFLLMAAIGACFQLAWALRTKQPAQQNT